MTSSNKPWPRNYYEKSWCSHWRKVMCLFSNNTGLGKFVKRRMDKRFRREWKAEE